MKKILIATILFFLLSVSSVSACGYFKILSDAGVPVFNSYGYLVINGSQYPLNQKMILYNLTVDNLDVVGVDLTFVPTGDLINYVYGTEGYTAAHSKSNISMNVYVDGPFREGIIYVEVNCDNGFFEGVIPVRIYGRGNGLPPACGSTDYSCGVYPNCTNVNILDNCYGGYFRDYFCSNNLIKFNKQGNSYCCGLVGGTYQNGACTFGSTTTSTTTTTIPTTTTTIQTGCTPSLALNMTGCYDGQYRNYFCSGSNLKYTSSCTSYCCGLLGNSCDASGLCDPPITTTTTSTTSSTTTSTTTTIPTTTTTVPSSSSTTTTVPTTTTTLPQTCTPAYALNLSGCWSGYFRNYFCSGSNLKYTESCYDYCCNLVKGTCQNGICSGSLTTTTTSTTTTTIPTICTTSAALKLSGCYDGYMRDYFCSGSQFKYSSSCTSYCCSLIKGNCYSGVCIK